MNIKVFVFLLAIGMPGSCVIKPSSCFPFFTKWFPLPSFFFSGTSLAVFHKRFIYLLRFKTFLTVFP